MIVEDGRWNPSRRLYRKCGQLLVQPHSCLGLRGGPWRDGGRSRVAAARLRPQFRLGHRGPSAQVAGMGCASSGLMYLLKLASCVWELATPAAPRRLGSVWHRFTRASTTAWAPFMQTRDAPLPSSTRAAFGPDGKINASSTTQAQPRQYGKPAALAPGYPLGDGISRGKASRRRQIPPWRSSISSRPESPP